MKLFETITLTGLVTLAALPAFSVESDLPPPARAKANVVKIDDSASEREAKRNVYSARLEQRREAMGDLERLADRPGWHHAPTWEEIMPYRFGDVSKLRAMLIDPDFCEHWSVIVATIAKVADRKAAISLIDFIKRPDFPPGFQYEHSSQKARVDAVGALSFVEYEQNLPEVLEFLEQLSDDGYVKSLGFPSHEIPAVRNLAAVSLSVIASDQSIAILEKLKDRAARGHEKHGGENTLDRKRTIKS